MVTGLDHVRDPYPNAKKRAAIIAIDMDDEIATIGSFSPEAICKVKVQLAVQGIYGANLHIRVTLKVDSFVDETTSDDEHSMDFFFGNGLKEPLRVEIVPKTANLPQAIVDDSKARKDWLGGKLAKLEIVYRKVIDFGVHTGINIADSTNQVALNGLRKIDKIDRITVYMRDYLQLTADINELNQTIDAEKMSEFEPFKSLRYGKKKKRVHVQLGQTVSIEEAGLPELPQMSAFSCPDDWYMVNAYMHVWEHEWLARQYEEINASEAKIYLVKAGPGKFLAIFEKPASAQQVKAFEVGENFYVKTNEDSENEEQWTGRVVYNLPGLPANQAYAIVTLPENVNGDDFPSSVKWNGEDDTAFINAWLRIEPNETDLKRRINCLNAFQALDDVVFNNFKQWVAGHDLTVHKRVNVLAGLTDAEIDIVASFTESQWKAFEYLKALPNGEGLIQGPPGTGKSFFITRIIRMCLKIAERQGSKDQKYLVCAHSNGAINNLADNFNKEFPEYKAIRFYSPSADEGSFLGAVTSANADRPSTNAEETRQQVRAFLQEDMAELQAIHDWNPKQRTKKQASNSRLLHMSTLARALERAGITDAKGEFIVPTGSEPEEPDEQDIYRNFRLQFWKYNSLDKEEMKAFAEAMERIAQDTLRDATVIFSTCSNANSKWLKDNFKPTGYFCDEAGHGDEVMTLSPSILFAKSLRWSILIGDHMQLRPFGHTINLANENPLRHQMRYSGFERRKLLHMESAILLHQHRMTEGLEWYSSEQCYGGRLENAEGTGLHHEERRLSRKFMDFMKESYGKETMSCFFDVDNTISEAAGTSRMNTRFAYAVVTLLARVFTFFTDPEELRSQEICLIVPYQGQIKLLTEILARLAKLPEWSRLMLPEVEIQTIDGVQGQEFDLVIADLTLGGAAVNLGITRDLHRLNVMMSRAKKAMFLIGDSRTVSKAKPQLRKYLEALFEGFRRKNWLVPLDGSAFNYKKLANLTFPARIVQHRQVSLVNHYMSDLYLTTHRIEQQPALPNQQSVLLQQLASKLLLLFLTYLLIGAAEARFPCVRIPPNFALHLPLSTAAH